MVAARSPYRKAAGIPRPRAPAFWRDDRRHAEAIGRRYRQRDARADERAVLEVIVLRVAAAVGDGQCRRDRKRIGRVDHAGVSAPVGHIAQRELIAAVVSLRAARHPEFVLMAGRGARLHGAGQQPRREIRLAEHAAHHPVALIAHRRPEPQVGGTARRVAAGKSCRGVSNELVVSRLT